MVLPSLSTNLSTMCVDNIYYLYLTMYYSVFLAKKIRKCLQMIARCTVIFVQLCVEAHYLGFFILGKSLYAFLVQIGHALRPKWPLISWNIFCVFSIK
jgi:hypothetical protein